MKLLSIAPPTGHLTIQKRYPDGTIETLLDEDNLIVYGGRQLLLRALYLSSYTIDPITSLHVGSGGTIDPAGLYPKTPSTDLTVLYNQVLSVPTSYNIVSSSIPSVTFLASIDQTQCNGTLINEAGLFTTLGVMFNIKTFTGIPKTSSFAIDFLWTISIA